MSDPRQDGHPLMSHDQRVKDEWEAEVAEEDFRRLQKFEVIFLTAGGGRVKTHIWAASKVEAMALLKRRVEPLDPKTVYGYFVSAVK